MDHTFIPDDEPLEVTAGETGPALQFGPAIEARQTFLRVIALWRDGKMRRGPAPTFDLQPDGGRITSVDADAGDVKILSDHDGTSLLGKANCRRLPDDIYLITIHEISEEAGDHWQLSITNNDRSEALRFVTVSSKFESKTLQPWLRVLPREPDANALYPPTTGDGVPHYVVRGKLHGSPGGPLPVKIAVANYGTGTLEIHTPLGPLDSEDPEYAAGSGGRRFCYLLAQRPDDIPPHNVSEIVVMTSGDVSDHYGYYSLKTNDPVPHHARLYLTG
jgi:hypothetical protein